MPIKYLQMISTSMRVLGVALLVGAIFFAGWLSSKDYYKTQTQVVTKTITVQVGPPGQPEKAPVVDHGVVDPGVHYVDGKDQPSQPGGSAIPPLEHPTDTTTITVSVPTPMRLQVFHQSELKWARAGDTYNIWNEGRVWTRDEKGQTLPGVTADTTYTKDAELSLPVSFNVQVPKEHPWSAGGIFQFAPHKGYGAYVDRDIGPVRVGAQVVRVVETPAMKPYTDTSVKVGWVF